MVTAFDPKRKFVVWESGRLMLDLSSRVRLKNFLGCVRDQKAIGRELVFFANKLVYKGLDVVPVHVQSKALKCFGKNTIHGAIK